MPVATKVKVVYCHCGGAIIAGCVMPNAETNAKWAATFEYYLDLGHRLGLIDGPVSVGKCNCNKKHQ